MKKPIPRDVDKKWDLIRSMGALGGCNHYLKLDRDDEDKGLSESGNPSFVMVFKVLKALGLRLDVSMAA